ncbi:MAG TPA: hypothetical protein VNS55_00855 [Nocardioides sp.]|nr:hypothetical protein [Nocardioides sp.]
MSTPPLPPPPPPYGWPGGPPTPPPPPPGGRRTPWGLIVAAVLVVLVLVAGAVVAVVVVRSGDDEPSASPASSTPSSSSAATTGSTDGSSPTVSASAPSLTAPPAVDTSAVVGTWQGTYTCAQGATGLSLDIRATSDKGLEATFHFRKIPQNPDVPEGSYAMKGFLVNGKLRLRRQAWIDRPQGYVMVGLNARVTDPAPQRLTGTVSNVGCQGFTITRR